MTVIRREDYPDTPWGERTFLIADRDEWCCKAVERASELESVHQQLEGAVDALLAAPMPEVESTLKGEQWAERYGEWWHEHVRPHVIGGQSS